MEVVVNLEKPKKTADSYLVDPFMSTVNSPSFYSSTGVMKILVGVTGQGKTYNTSQVFIPHLVKKHNVELVVVSVPQTEILDISDFVKSAAKSGMQWTDDALQAIEWLEDGIPVLLTTTHQSFSVTDKGVKLQEYMKNSSLKYAVFVDEAHTWLISHILNVKKVSGNPTTVYEAKMFNALSDLSKKTPYIFGLTATPQAEQLGTIEPIGDMSFDIINEMAPKSLTIDKTAWMGSTTYYDASFQDTFDINVKFENMIIKLYTQSMSTGIKKAMMVSCGYKTASTGYTLAHVKHLVIQALSVNNLVVDTDKVIAVMTGKKEETGVYSINGSFEKMDEQEIKKKLIDNNDPLQIALVVNKGKMGMNIPTLKSLVSFKPQDKSYEDGGAITELAIQLLGRLVRLNTGMKLNDFTKEFGYSLENYVKTIDKETLNNLIVANTMDVMIPNTDMWIAANTQFQDKFVSSVTQAKTWIDSVKKVEKKS